MNLQRLTARQKRAKDWEDFALGAVNEPALRNTILKAISEYRNLLLTAWESGSSSSQPANSTEFELQLEDLERRLVDLNELARLKSHQTVPAKWD